MIRDAELVNRLSNDGAGHGFPGRLFTDPPAVDAIQAVGRMILGVMVQVAQLEAERFGERTREELAFGLTFSKTGLLQLQSHLFIKRDLSILPTIPSSPAY